MRPDDDDELKGPAYRHPAEVSLDREAIAATELARLVQRTAARITAVALALGALAGALSSVAVRAAQLALLGRANWYITFGLGLALPVALAFRFARRWSHDAVRARLPRWIEQLAVTHSVPRGSLAEHARLWMPETDRS